MAASEAELAARLLERLLADPAFRARFRRDPAAACREAGLDDLALEMSVGVGKAMHTLDVRESKSSLAGVMMAAAMEGVAIYQFTENILPHLEEIPGQIADVLSRVDLPAVPNVFDKPLPKGGGASTPATPPAGAEDPLGGGEAGESTSNGGAAGAAAPPPAAPAETPPPEAADAGKADAGKEQPPPEAAEEKPEQTEGQKAAEKIAEENSPEAEQERAEKAAGDALDERQTGLPESSDLPTGDAPPEAPPAEVKPPEATPTPPPEAASPAPSAPSAPEAPATETPPPAEAPAGEAPPPPKGASNALPSGEAAPAANALPDADGAPANALPTADGSPASNALPSQPADDVLGESTRKKAAAADAATGRKSAAAAAVEPVKRRPIDPAEFGAEGKGGEPSPEALALLKNKNVVLDDVGVKDIKAGRIDPRVIAVLTKLSQEHKITVSCMCSDHSKFTSGGSISNHHLGRGLDIAAIDGEIVGPGSPLAREVASELSELKSDYRPDEIGSPFAISGPGYFTDAAHQNHLHVGFKQEIARDWKPPKDVAVDGGEPAAPVAASAAAVAPAAPVAAPAAVAPVAPAAAAVPAVAAPVAEPPPEVKTGSQGFLKAVTASDAEADRKQRHASQGFLKAVEPPKAAAAAAPAADAALAANVAAPTTYPGDDAPKEQIAAWMAGLAEKRGLPRELPIMAGLVESGLKNLNFGDADSVGFFQMRVGIWNQGEYAGYPDKPELQMEWFLDTAEQVKKARIAAGKPIDDPQSYGEWIADVERPAEQYRGRYQLRLDEARTLLANSAPAPAAVPAAAPAGALVDAAASAGGGGSSLGSAALKIAQSQHGVKEVGTNTGPKVNEYLAAAKVPPGNPWCASFITWAMEKAGHKMPGGGWAAVQTWVRSAEQGNNNLKIVSAAEARPGDIVAYDWGGQEDFGADGHIGFLESTVKGGKFTALEGNNNDRVDRLERSMGSANVKFIRIEGNASPGAAQAVAPAAGVPAVEAPAPSKPIDPAQFGGEGAGTGGPPSAEALALLKNKNVVLDDVGIKDIKEGRIDPRVIAVLTKLSQEHKITVSCMCSDHSKFTAGGSISNHYYGRGLDIAAIDGEIVGPGSPLAREVASELSTLDEDYRPNEIGSPFAINGPGYFTDAAHQNHLHVGFKQAITPDWTPPADVAAQAAAAVPAGAPVASAAAVAPGGAPAPEPPKRGSAGFLRAVTAEAADADRKKRHASAGFLKAVEPPQASAAAAQPAAPAAPAAPADAGAADAAAAAASAAPTTYPGDDAPKEQIAAWMAGMASERGLPPQLPIMAGLVESGLKNLNFGHADSVGFFQMRVGIWNQGAYAGYPDKPELQMKWFLDQAEAVKRQRLVAGKPVDDPNHFGEWVADVERPAEQFRYKYQTRLEEANGLLESSASAPPAAAAPAAPAADPAAAAASVAAVGDAKLPADIAGPVQEAIAAGHAPGPKALAAIQEASKYLGTDYKWGGSTPQTGFDCSGLMQWSYAQSGVQIPRVTYTQVEAGTEVADRADLAPGDLVFFGDKGDPHHVGMYLGGDKFLHAPRTGDVVKVSSLSEPYYAQQFSSARRFDSSAPVAAAPAAASAPVAAAAAVDPTEVAKAQAAVARDAAEVRRHDSALFMAVKAEEANKQEELRRSQMFLRAVDPSQVKRPPEAAAAAAPPAAVEPAAAPPVTPAAAPVTPAAPAVAPTPPPEAVGDVSIDLSNAASDYPGDDAGQEELAKWLAKQAEKAGLPPELPVMAALVESGVKNLNYGDADSVGFFQMRVGIWNQGPYAGYPEKPELQAKWFIDQALALKRKRIAQGLPDFGKDPAKWGEWIADVERPAEQYRGRYQLRLAEARKLLS